MSTGTALVIVALIAATVVLSIAFHDINIVGMGATIAVTAVVFYFLSGAADRDDR